jgi:hypothetical protein
MSFVDWLLITSWYLQTILTHSHAITIWCSRTSGNNDVNQYLDDQMLHRLLLVCFMKSLMNMCPCSTVKVSMYLFRRYITLYNLMTSV